MNWKRLAPAFAGAALALTITLTNARASSDQPIVIHPLLGTTPTNTYVVTKTGDSGDNTNTAPGTLRRALVDANNHPGLDLIRFDLPGSGLKTITIVNYFPNMTDNAGVIIDGTLSDDQIELNGSGVTGHNGLTFTSDNNVVRGLTINGVSGGGVAIALLGGADNNVIVGNRLGTNAAGTAKKANHSGVFISSNSNNNIIGGTNGVTPGGACTGDCNLISGNQYHGVVIDHSSGNRVIGNLIGLNRAGTAALGNGDDGVLIGNADHNTIGGSSPAERNVISGNIGINIEIGENPSHHNQVLGNYIGTNSAGNGVVNNPGSGILVDLGAHDNTIDSNLVSGHADFGILVFLNAGRTTIRNNRVGISASGDENFGNRQKGIELQGNGNTVINNRVGYSGNAGILVKKGSGNLLSRNTVFSNGRLGIDLGLDAVTLNDPGDNDGGANGLQNFPDLKSAAHDGTTLTVSGNLNSKPSARYTLEFFYNPACDNVFGYTVGEAAVYLGTTAVTTNSGGNAGFSLSLSGVPTNGVVTATATDSANNTSELSFCATITQGGTQPPPLTKPQLLSPPNGEGATKNPPTLDWQPVNGAVTYRVLIRMDDKNGQKVLRQKGLTSDSFVPPKLTVGKTYYWRAFACDTNNKCTKSIWWTFSIR